MRQQFGIDKLITHSLEDIPDTTLVVNPEYRDLTSYIRRLNGFLNRKATEYGQINYKEAIEPNEAEKFLLKKLVIIDEIECLKDQISKL